MERDETFLSLRVHYIFEAGGVGGWGRGSARGPSPRSVFVLHYDWLEKNPVT